MGINYGHRFLDARIAALYGEIEFVALPNRNVTAATATVPQSYASLYLAPGLRLKFFPSSRALSVGRHWRRLRLVPAVREAAKLSIFLNLRVTDIMRYYELWSSRGAKFITEPKAMRRNCDATRATRTGTSLRSDKQP